MFRLKLYALMFALVIGLLTAFGQTAQGQTVVNPSFEVDNVPASPGYGAITGWTVTGLAASSGINDATGQFADNGAIPDGQKVAFLHQSGGDSDGYVKGGTMRQTVSGFTVGAQYRLRYFENASIAGSPFRKAYLQASVGGAVVVPIQYDPADENGVTKPHEVLQVGGTNPYVLKVSEPFTATAESLEIAFTTGGRYDYTVLLDNVSVLPDGAVGANLLVTNNFDSGGGSLRQAVNGAPRGSTIRFSDAVRGAILLTSGGITIDKNLTIVGPGAGLLTVRYGGFGVNSGVSATISGLTISDGGGTGITSSGNLTVVDSVVSGNAGGGIATRCSRRRVEFSYFICLVQNQLTIINSNISDNRSEIGAGISISLSEVAITNSSITGNAASKVTDAFFAAGAGIYNKGGRLTITNSTIADNEDENSYRCIVQPCFPGVGGDGITMSYEVPQRSENADDGDLTLINATVTDNILGVAHVRNSIIYGLGDGNRSNVDSQGNNLFVYRPYITGDTTGNIYDVDPRLGPLGYYGGTTPTRPLLPGSPAVNTGNTATSPAFDQRGAARVGTADIGAFEVNNPANGGSFVAQLPDAFTEILYSQLLVKDTMSFSYSLTGGALPTGISLSTGTGRVKLRGRTAQTGVFNFSVTATDVRDATKSFVTNYRLRVLASGLPPFGDCRSNVVVADSSDDGEGTLRQAVIDVCPGGTITFGAAARGTISLTTGPLVIDKNLTIAGPGADALKIRNGAGKGVIVAVQVGVTAVLSGLTISDGRDGGIGNAGNLTVRNAVIKNNQSEGSGGGINSSGTLTLVNSVVTGNGEMGVGAFNGDSFGGGIYFSGTSMTITDSTVAGNSANVGGGIYVTNGGSASMTNSTIGDNSATNGYGGGLHLNNATATLTNCTVSQNTARGGDFPTGGGIFVNEASTLTLINSTIANNQLSVGEILSLSTVGSAGVSNGDYVFTGGTVNVRNSLIAGNTLAFYGHSVDFAGTLTSQGYNFIGNTRRTQITGVTTGNIVGANPLLGPLANNGGPTMTNALLPGSPAINTGNTATSPTTDQRGAARVGTADIGAFEFNDSTPTPTPTITPTPTPTATPTPTITPTPTPVVSRQNGRIAFDSIRNGNQDIYTINPDGTDERQVTTTTAFDFQPSFSPDGTRIAFRSGRNGNNDIFTINADGTNERQVTTNTANDVEPSFSPDGTRIAFRSNRNGNDDIYTINADGTDERRVTTNPAGDLEPSFSPDGTRLVFSSGRTDNYDIYTINADGTNERQVTTNTANDSDPSWSPDGTRLAFARFRNFDYDIYTINPDGTNERQVTTNPAYDYEPSFSPDGTRIAFRGFRNGNFDIYTINADGTNERQVTTNAAGDVAPSWGGAVAATPTPTPTATPTATPTPSPTPTPNTPPNAAGDVSSVNEDTTLNINAPGVLGNDTDGEGNSLTAVVQTSPANAASFTLNANGSFSYTPNPNFNGTDSFTYKASDGSLLSNAATVTITVNPVNDNPDAVNDNATVAEDSGANTISVRNNDNIAPDTGETLFVSAVTQGANGSVSITNSGANVSYTPNANFNGTDSFTYTISDGNGGTDTATVNITVTSVNDNPDAVNDSATVTEDSGANTINVRSNDSIAPDTGETLTVSSVTQGASGTVAITNSGADLSYAPNANFNGTDSFTYTVSDGNGGTDTATVTVTVTAVNDAPTLDAIGNKTTNESAALIFAATGNDNADSPPNSLAYSLIGAPSGAAITTAGAFSWTPTEAQGPGQFTFRVRVTDNGTPNLFDEEEITVTVREVNAAPALGAIGNLSGYWGNTHGFTATATDSDFPANMLTYTLTGTVPTGASITAAGVFTWTPTSMQLGTYTFTVSVTDNGTPALSDSKTITITVGKRPTRLIYSGAAAGQYSDSVTLTATLADNGGGSMQGLPLAGRTVNYTLGSQAETEVTNASGVAGKSLVLTQMAQSLNIVSQFGGDGLYQSSGDSDPFTINKEDVETIYTGDSLIFTAGPTIGTASAVRLSARLTQLDSEPGNLALAKVRFELYKFSNGSTTPTFTFANIAVDAAGNAETTVALAVDDAYTVRVVIEPANGYWTANPAGDGTLVVAYGTTERRVTGGGWVPDAASANNKGHFGFTVNYRNNGSPSGNALYTFRGTDGYNYRVKSNSWQGGGLTFYGDPWKAAFSGKCNVQKIDPLTGATVESWGNYTFTVDLVDGDLKNPRETDRYAVQILTDAGAIWKQIGTRTAPVQLGGGNVAVKSN